VGDGPTLARSDVEVEMMITLELTPQDAEFLSQQLATQIDHLQYELVHTDDRSLHRAVADDLARLEALRHRLARVSKAA
jgi:hypothetical protein